MAKKVNSLVFRENKIFIIFTHHNTIKHVIFCIHTKYTIFNKIKNTVAELQNTAFHTWQIT